MCSPDIDSRSKRSSLAAGAAGSEPPQIICDMRLQPPERLVLDEEADGFEGVVGSTGKLVDGRDRHIQPADETIESGFELFQGKAEVRQFAIVQLLVSPAVRPLALGCRFCTPRRRPCPPPLRPRSQPPLRYAGRTPLQEYALRWKRCRDIVWRTVRHAESISSAG